MIVRSFRKKPVVIAAVRLEMENAVELADWCGGDANRFEHLDDDHDRWLGIAIPTLEGEMIASPGDWIVRGVQGEFYPVKPAIFDATYEAVAQ
jgi:hypothetical protein